MSAFNSWLLSIVGIIFIGVLVDLILPNGQTSKYIKSIFSIIVIFVIITPLIKLTNNNFDIKDILQEEITIDENYIESINKSRITALSQSIIDEASNYGLAGIEVQIESRTVGVNLTIDKVNLYLGNMVIDENFMHIDKYKLLVGVVQKYIDIEKDCVIFYE